jgi:hypothetical protein
MKAALQWTAAMAGTVTLSAVTLCAAGLCAVGLPAAGAAARALPAARFTHTCLVGTWHDERGRTYTEWGGHRVAMRGGAGNIDHILATGVDHDIWGRHAKPYYGTYRGHRLKEVLRGRNTVRIKGTGKSDKLRLAEEGWSAGSTNIYTYRGRKYSGYFNQSGTYTMYFRCTARTLTWRFRHRRDRETRISRKP